jgi:glycosyltransferase involved in cell wall biosynthesis
LPITNYQSADYQSPITNMKIGLITGEYPPMQGGVGDFTRELARALAQQGHAVHVITGTGAGDDDGVRAHRLIKSWGVGCWRRIAAVVRQQQLDVLNIQYEPAAYAMQVGVNFLPSRYARRLIKAPIVTTYHDLLMPYLFPKAGPLRWKVVEYLARRSDAVIVTNEEDRLRLSNLQLPTSNLQPPISNLHLIPIGSNILPAQADVLDVAAERERWRIGPDEFAVGYFGFLNLSKGGEALMQALRLLLDQRLPARLILVGSRIGASDPTNAAYAAQVEALIEALDLKDHVSATGYLDAGSVSRALLACDVLALPYVDGASVRRGSLMAAIAHGRPIVTTEPRYPIEGLTAGESAIYVPPNDPPALAQALKRVLLDPALRARLAQAAREAAKLYTWDRIAAKTLEVFRAVTSDEPMNARP